jgi:hypothetical protein
MGKDSIMHNGLFQLSNVGSTVQMSPATSQTASVASVTKSYYDSMWNPNKFGFKPGHAIPPSNPPPCFAFGLEEIPSMTAANDHMQYQEGQGFWRLDVELHGYSKWHTSVNYEPRKMYTENIYSYDDAAMLIPEDHGQGTIYGRYWS